MKIRTSDFVLLLVSVLIGFALIEGGYRVFLSAKVEQERKNFHKPGPSPTFGVWAWPAPWRFDRAFGFKYNDGPWPSAAIQKGIFAACGTEGPGNRFGNYGLLRGEYEQAQVKIAMFGSSYTLVDGTGKGDTVTNLLQERLAKRLGKTVNVLNFSKDSTGVLTMFDTARAVARDNKPDLILFAFNGEALDFPRLWRVVKEVKPDFYRMYHTRDPAQTDTTRAMVHVTPITKRLTAAWCAEMAAAKKRGDTERLRNDPLVRELLAEYDDIMSERTMPRVIVDFFTLRTSFVLRYIRYGDPFHRIRKFSEESIWAPLPPGSYGADADFVEAVKALTASGIPFYMVQIPTLRDMQAFRTVKTGRFVVADAGHASAIKTIEDVTARKLIPLVEHYPRALLADPIQLVTSEADSHPSPKGVALLAEILERVVVDPGQFQRH